MSSKLLSEEEEDCSVAKEGFSIPEPTMGDYSSTKVAKEVQDSE